MNHLKTVLLKQQGTGHIDPEFNHYKESLELICTLVSNEVDPILSALLREFSAQFESTATIGFPGMGSMAKEMTYIALTDAQLTCTLLLAGLSSQNLEIVNLALDLYWLVCKKSIERAQLDHRICHTLLPIILKLAKSNPKAKSVLDNMNKKLKMFQLYQIFTSIFNRDKRTRLQAYSTIFKLEFFDTCLNFTSPVGIVSDGTVLLPGMTHFATSFTDPLDGIVDSSGRLAFVEKLAAFPDKSAQKGRITQAQIKSLYELLNIALNTQLEFNVRGVALDQINEAIFFYKDSAALKDFCTQLLGLCRDNLNEFGSKRENFSMILANLKSLDESFISHKSSSDLPIQNKFYEQEKGIAAKYLSIYNGILHHFKHVMHSRSNELETIFTQDKNKGFCRALWILATEKDVSHRYQALLLLNLIFISGSSILTMLGSKSFEDKLANADKESGCYPIFEVIANEFHVLYKGIEVKSIDNLHPLRNIDENKKEFIMKFIESFTGLSASKENRHLEFDPETNKEKIISYLIEQRLSRCIQVYSKALKTDGHITTLSKWTNIGLLASCMEHPNFYEDRAIIDSFFTQMRDLLSQGKDELFLDYNTSFRNLFRSKLFKNLYLHMAAQKNFLELITIFYHQKLLPLIYEIHVEAFAQKHDLILGVLSFMTTTLKLAMSSNDQKLLVIIRTFITKPAFVEFLSDILRKYEAMDIVNSTLVEFLRWHFDLFLRSEGEKKYMECVQFMFDSSLICTRTDNFVGMTRLLNILKLCHNMCTRNQLLTAGDQRELFEEVKDMKKEDVPVPIAFKTSTIAWIVSLLDHRSIAVRMMCWNLIANYFDATLLELFPSLIDNAIATLNLVNESSGVLSLCYFFLFKSSRLVSTLSCLDSVSKIHGRTVSKDEFVRKVHDRKAIETVRRIIAQDECPPMLLANCLRFTVEWYNLDANSITNKYFHTDFMDKLVHHLEYREGLELAEFTPGRVKSLCEQLSGISLLMNFFIVTSRGNSTNCIALIKNFGAVEIVLKWLAFCGRLLKAPVALQSEFQRENAINIHNKFLHSTITELAKNGIHLLEVFIYEDKELFLDYLEDHENSQPSDLRLLSIVGELMTHDTSSTSLGYRLLKLTSKILLTWDLGYQLLDREDSAATITDCLISRCMQFFKSIDYLKISDSDYLKIINSEEIMHILSVIIAKSDLMKEKFLSSGLFQLYVTKFLQIIRSFKKDINYITVSGHKKDSSMKIVNSSLSHSKSSIAPGYGKKPTIVKSSQKLKEDQTLATKTTRLNENIRQITANSAGHIKSYVQIAKYFFHNSLKLNLTGQAKHSCDLLEARIGDLMEIVNFLWIHGQEDDVRFFYTQEILTDLLELLINWHLSNVYSASLFKRLIDQKYTLLTDILSCLAK
jgi:hypothetical protein